MVSRVFIYVYVLRDSDIWHNLFCPTNSPIFLAHVVQVLYDKSHISLPFCTHIIQVSGKLGKVTNPVTIY